MLERLHYIVWNIYKMPLYQIRFLIVLSVLCWTIISMMLKESYARRLLNRVLSTGAVLCIVFQTIINRSNSEASVSLLPFYTFIEAKQQPELLRAMLMNVFLFVPLGLTLPYAIPNKNRHIVCFTIAAAACLAIVIELMQLVFHLGRCETDDVLMNTLGAAIGSLSFLIYNMITKFSVQRKRE